MVSGENISPVCTPGCIRSPGGEMTLVHVSINYDLLNKMEQSFGPSVWDVYYNYVKSSATQHIFPAQWRFAH